MGGGRLWILKSFFGDDSRVSRPLPSAFSRVEAWPKAASGKPWTKRESELSGFFPFLDFAGL